MVSKLLLHVGMPKSASTTLQEELFSRIPESINYLGLSKRHGSNFSAPALELGRCLHAGRECQIESIRERLSNSKLNVLSHELLMRPWFIWPPFKECDPVELWPIKLGDIFRTLGVSEVKILLVLRCQPDVLLSAYNYQLVSIRQQTEIASVNDVVRLLESRPEYKKCFDYSRIVQAYANVFGSANIHCLLFEELRDNPHEFARSLAPILTIEAERVLEGIQAKHRDASISAVRHKFRSRGVARVAAMLGHRYYRAGLLALLPAACQTRSKKI